MKIDVTDVSPVKKTMSVEIDPEAVEKETATVLRQYVKKARIPGFRPGRAPLEIVRTRFAKEVEEDVVERVVSRYHRQATKERGLEPLGDPVVEEVVHNRGEPLRFLQALDSAQVGQRLPVERADHPGQREDERGFILRVLR